MWELIAKNQRNSILVFFGMGLCLIVLGFFIGAAVSPDEPYSGILIAAAIWLFLSALSFFAGDSILLASSGAKEITPHIHPQLYNVVEEMKIAANLPAMPKIYIMDDPALNAFATGRNPQNSAVTVTAGLLSRLNRDQLQGVIAHEMSHILNRDTLFLTFAGVMLGSITLMAESFLRGMRYSAYSSRYRGRSRSDGQAIIILVAVIFALLAPLLARIFYFALSRRREYLADASAARLTRYPEGLASALEVLVESEHQPAQTNSITAPMYIINP